MDIFGWIWLIGMPFAAFAALVLFKLEERRGKGQKLEVNVPRAVVFALFWPIFSVALMLMYGLITPAAQKANAAADRIAARIDGMNPRDTLLHAADEPGRGQAEAELDGREWTQAEIRAEMAQTYPSGINIGQRPRS